MLLKSIALLLALVTPALAQTPPVKPPVDLPDAPSTTSNAHAPVVPTGPTVLFDTTMGRLTCKFYDKQAPITVANFIGLAEGTKDWTDPVTLKKVHGKRFYRRHHLPPRHPRLHDPGRRPPRHRHRRPRLHV